MQRLRKRIPFAFQSEIGGDEQIVLDEQEQAEVVEEFRQQNVASHQQYRNYLQIMLGLSCLLHVIYWFSERESPLFTFFPPSPLQHDANSPLDISGILAYVAILIHVNLCLLVHPRNIVVAGHPIRAIGFLETFAWSAAAPIISIYWQKAWQTTAWWCTSGFLTAVVYVIHGWIERADEEVRELEKLRYRAAGA
ncbi:hypothetical protein F5I97DRAFT_1928623 [Phlebopus sp. FC_14]|nr:hypothetical protein F5I97DRAFT_1928623 [Phlebopus sp. FC_14]